MFTEKESVVSTCWPGGAFDRNREALSANREPNLPEDLREWIEESELEDIISEAVEGNAPEAGMLAPLLKVLAFNYAIGTFCSEEIAQRLEENPCSRMAWPMELSDAANYLKHFRRLHRIVLQKCLAEVLSRIWKSLKDNNNLEDGPNFMNEAQRRINTAVRLDCWAADC